MVAFIYNDSTVQLASGSLHGGSVAVLLLLSILLNDTAATVWPGSTGCSGAVERHCRLESFEAPFRSYPTGAVE